MPEHPGRDPGSSSRARGHKKDSTRSPKATTSTAPPGQNKEQRTKNRAQRTARTASGAKGTLDTLTSTSTSTSSTRHLDLASLHALPLAAAQGTHSSSTHTTAYITTMPSSSHLRIETAFEPIPAETTRSYFVASPPQKKQKMSLTQTYYIAASARSKLGKEACRADHDLRLLVGHANLLDSLMIELQDAERQQEAWFHSTVAKASKAEQQQRQQQQQEQHVQWADSIAEEDEDDDSASDSDSDSEYYDEDGDFDMVALPRRLVQSPVQITTTEVDDEDDEDQYDDLEDDADLALTRVPSQSPPELVHDEDSDDESPPVSPPQVSMEFSEKEAMLTTSFYDAKSQAYMEDALFPPESTAPLITSY